MDLTLYGICFKMRGGPDLLDYVQSNTPVPVEVMQQVINQMGTVTQDELAFAEMMRGDWKKAFNERVPLQMKIGDDGGYDITCTVPDELLDTAHVLTGYTREKLVKDYTANHLKNVCGVDADIISVDVEKHEAAAVQTAPVQAAPVQGFDLNDLAEEPEAPAFENVEMFGDMAVGLTAPVQPVQDEVLPVQEEEGIPVEEGYPEEGHEEEPEGYVEEPEFVEEPEYVEEPGMEDFVEEAEEAPEEEEPVQEEAASPDSTMQEAMAGIYTELVGNIRDRKLDERLGIKIGQHE